MKDVLFLLDFRGIFRVGPDYFQLKLYTYALQLVLKIVTSHVNMREKGVSRHNCISACFCVFVMQKMCSGAGAVGTCSGSSRHALLLDQCCLQLIGVAL